jgi:hypothetical protein
MEEKLQKQQQKEQQQQIEFNIRSSLFIDQLDTEELITTNLLSDLSMVSTPDTLTTDTPSISSLSSLSAGTKFQQNS